MDNELILDLRENFIGEQISIIVLSMMLKGVYNCEDIIETDTSILKQYLEEGSIMIAHFTDEKRLDIEYFTVEWELIELDEKYLGDSVVEIVDIYQ